MYEISHQTDNIPSVSLNIQLCVSHVVLLLVFLPHLFPPMYHVKITAYTPGLICFIPDLLLLSSACILLTTETTLSEAGKSSVKSDRYSSIFSS